MPTPKTKPRAYAEDTDVPVARSITEVRKLLKDAGATNLSTGEDDGPEPFDWVTCRLHGWNLRFVVRRPVPGAYERNHLGHRLPGVAARVEQEHRRRWRVLVLLLRAKLVAIRDESVSFAEEFLAYAVLPDTRTVGEAMTPHIEQLQQGLPNGGTALLLPPGRAA